MVPVSVADDQIYERYQAKAISEINRLGHEVTEALADRHPNAAPVMGTGHPLADIMLVKYAPQPPRCRRVWRSSAAPARRCSRACNGCASIRS